MDDLKRPSMNGSKNVLYPSSITFSEKRRTTLERCLLCFVLFFFLATGAFAGLFAYYYISYQDKVSTVSQTGASRGQNDLDSAAGNLCTTPDCVETASMMIKKIDFATNPCEDFYQFACGRFIKEEVIPKGLSSVGTVVLLHEANQLVLKAILEEEPKADDPNYLTLLKDLYASCVDEDAIEVIGVQPYLDSEFAQDWPTLNPRWDPTTFDLNHTLLRFAKEFVTPLVHYVVANDFMDSDKEVIFVGEPHLLLPQEYYARERNDSSIMAVQKYYVDTAIELGADPATASEDARLFIDFERAVSALMVPKELLRDRAKLYRPTTLDQLEKTYPFINIRGVLEATFSTANISLPGSQKVIDPTPSYFHKLKTLIEKTGPRVLQNAFSFTHVKNAVTDLSRKMRDIRFELDKVVNGKKDRRPRTQVCTEWAANIFGEGMSKEFVKRKFSESSKFYIGEMIDDLQRVYRDMLDQATWMGPSTKERAVHKLSLMSRRIGYPDIKFSDDDINKLFENYTISRGNFFNNLEELKTERNIKKLQRITKPADKDEWHLYPHQVNAFYDVTSNGITFLAAILQPPFFSDKFPRSVNYGAIGSIIGHEITHGFDDTGSQYNDKGNLQNWWEMEDMKRFQARRQCVVDQYSGYKVEEINMNINGIHTQGENIADIGGLKESFRAYQESVRRTGGESRLPGLSMSPEQVFFLAYAQAYCERSNKERLVAVVSTKKHPPGRFRVLGPLQNSKEFSRVFQCPAGSPMNPANKCSVW